MAQIRLQLREATRLPPICMRCGQPAEEVETITISWFPPWVNWLAFLGLLPYAVVSALLTRKVTLQAPYCRRHRSHGYVRQQALAVAFFIFAVAMGTALAVHPPAYLWVGIVLFPALIVFVIVVHYTSVRPVEVTESHIVIAGVCDEFVDAMTREEYFSRERPDDEEPVPRESGRSSNSEAIQASPPPAPPRDEFKE